MSTGFRSWSRGRRPQKLGWGRQRGRVEGAGHTHEYLTHVCLGEGLVELSGNIKSACRAASITQHGEPGAPRGSPVALPM